MSAHSPAPWRYCPKTGQIVDVNNRQIARVWNTSNRERDHANGELIAASPAWQQNYLDALDTITDVAEENGQLLAALAKCVEALEKVSALTSHQIATLTIQNALMAARPLLDDTQPMNLDAPPILAYELKDNPGHEYERHVADLNDARAYLQSRADMIVWAELSDADGNVIAGTEELL
jgi:hypothetical protein